MVNILALDQGATTGWAFISNEVTAHGTKKWPLTKNDGEKYNSFWLWLADKIDALRPDIIVYEMPIFRGKRSAFLFGFVSLIKMCAYFKGNIKTVEVNIATAKKFVSGKGNATKEEMIAAIQSRGYSPKDDHQADSIGLMLYALAKEAPRLKGEI